MKKIFILMSILLVVSVNLFADIIYLNDGSIVKGKIVEQNDKKMTIKSESMQFVIDKDKIKKVEFKNEIEVYSEKKEQSDEEFYSSFLQQNSSQNLSYATNNPNKYIEREKQERANSVVSTGFGAGLLYGLVGFSGEVLVANIIGLGVGVDAIGTGMKNFNAKIYFGDKGSAFRWRLGGLVGDTHATIVTGAYEDVYVTTGKSIFTGFQWKTSSLLSIVFIYVMSFMIKILMDMVVFQKLVLLLH